MRIAFGAAGSAGAELDLGEVGRLVKGLLAGRQGPMEWRAAPVNWPKDWAKLLMNATLLAADSLPRGGQIMVETSGRAGGTRDSAFAPPARTRASSRRWSRPLAANPCRRCDGRTIQPFLTHKLARALNAGLSLSAGEGVVELVAG